MAQCRSKILEPQAISMPLKTGTLATRDRLNEIRVVTRKFRWQLWDYLAKPC